MGNTLTHTSTKWECSLSVLDGFRRCPTCPLCSACTSEGDSETCVIEALSYGMQNIS